MLNSNTNLIRNAINDNTPRNILISAYNGIFEYSLAANTNHSYYVITDKPEEYKQFFDVPNLYFLSSQVQNWPLYLNFDLIICNDIVSQIGLCENISKSMHIPMIIIHHCFKQPFIKKEDVQILAENHKNTYRIVTHPSINNSWYATYDISPYGVKTIPTVSNKDNIEICRIFF